ncbi:DUF423 domain-containing protein [Allorhodopirellula heiligendammensis]|uniref:DUF423 domain-containing protein n=1 Tax=Allorhodopirellula heiligendammensis TaxID=2714739 RepID=A0A5C6BDZ7_9BACT|nr:DUF423 domain-containing protein [Allorhodopirellula heiligendammensis]TWU10190.1 hypothetical protein Poly21_51600 [Allorhodopirellula heiligendammensis]
MMSNARTPFVAAAVAGALAVLIGAFGAHWLPVYLAGTGVDAELLAKRLAQFDTGARYHLAHAIALLALIALPTRPSATLRWSVCLFVAGIVFFSGSLYVLVLTNTPWLGAITPIGGGCWIIAWILIAFLHPSSRNA